MGDDIAKVENPKGDEAGRGIDIADFERFPRE
jgi:hypothetical protein